MLADAHRQAALDNEQTATDLGDVTAKPYIGRGLIELYWGAAFHWIAYGCQRKHGRHKENHSNLVSYLRTLGEPSVSTRWEALEQVRAGGWYGHKSDASEVQRASDLLREIRTWALT